ncbi:hypothetical protein GKZ28_05745 [Clostridium chromiireducens]|uniref:Uncharacterized protein n=1 Tax=Clostridium chromiireducens TaxID=225345 RepID=A0A964W194_9CLOT|nr:hypothetical protein [Clostridium chromiireducens]MVX63201.1 hypothetical protein [Clostridium chromiireducens]
MNKGPKSDSNNLQSFYSMNPEPSDKKQKEFSDTYTDHKEHKNAGNNDWNSVPTGFDTQESTKNHEKTATDNQWTSTHK